ncbi:MAG: hypothetical protein JNM18_16890 [Planctomycetaceae bacterium]|nr:hypothetical protein [Planctomycetaceae bacterium]
MLLDISATMRWFGDEPTLVDELVALLDRSGGRYRITVADTPSAAWAMLQFAAKTRPSPERESPSTERAEVWRAPPAEPRPTLDVLPVEALRLEPVALGWLHELGLRQVGQLAAFSRVQLAERFGSHLLQRWDQLWGDLAEALVPWHEPTEYHTRLDFDFATTHYETLLQVLEQQLTRLVAPLIERHEGLQRLECLLCGESGSLVPLQVAVLRPTVQVAYLLELLKLRLESQPLIEPITGVRLSATAVMPIEQRQQTLFATEQHEDDRWLWASLVERLSGRLGDQAVLRARLRSEHQPEYAWTETPWLDASLSRSSPPARRRPGTITNSTAPTPSLVTTRPLHLERRPIAVRMISAKPQRTPQQFTWRNESYTVTRCWGPERIETGWWRGRDVRRDYYRVETTTGQWFWVFRRLHDGAWFLHGWFE